jgi:hypothetical protein
LDLIFKLKNKAEKAILFLNKKKSYQKDFIFLPKI